MRMQSMSISNLESRRKVSVGYGYTNCIYELLVRFSVGVYIPEDIGLLLYTYSITYIHSIAH